MGAEDVLATAARYRAALDRRDARAMQRLIDAYGLLYRRLQAEIEALTLTLGDMDDATPGAVARLGRFRSLIRQVTEELNRYSAYLETEIQTNAAENIAQAAKDAEGLVRAYGVAGAFNRRPTSAIESLLGFLDPQGALFGRIKALAGFRAQYVADKILEGVGLGYNPKRIAAQIRDALGAGLTDAMRMTRTVQLYSYREATRANYIANSDVVQGWVWYAQLDADTCLSCIAQHGSVHGLDETLNDHHNGRCAMLPLVGDNPVEQAGEEWFNGLSEDDQRSMMGAARYEAWRDGKFGFGQLSGSHTDDVYGVMRVEASLKELLGE